MEMPTEPPSIVVTPEGKIVLIVSFKDDELVFTMNVETAASMADFLIRAIAVSKGLKATPQGKLS